MPKWIQSISRTISYGWDYSEGDRPNNNSPVREYYRPDYENLNAQLASTLDYLSKKQYSIKAVVPLTAANTQFNYDHDCKYSTTNQGFNGNVIHGGYGWGWGYGYGVTQHIGFVILAQKEIEISDEEYKLRIEINEQKEILVQELAQLEKSKASLVSQCSSNSIIKSKDDIPFVENKKLIGSNTYLCNNREFKSKDELEAYRDNIVAISQNIDGYNVKIQEVQTKLQELKAKEDSFE